MQDTLHNKFLTNAAFIVGEDKKRVDKLALAEDKKEKAVKIKAVAEERKLQPQAAKRVKKNPVAIAPDDAAAAADDDDVADDDDI